MFCMKPRHIPQDRFLHLICHAKYHKPSYLFLMRLYLKVKVSSFNLPSSLRCVVSHAAQSCIVTLPRALSWTLQSPQQFGNQAHQRFPRAVGLRAARD